jgi:hypothetical protein
MGKWKHSCTILDLGTNEGESSASLPGRFILGERPFGTHWIGGWTSLRAGVDVVGIQISTLPGMEPGVQLVVSRYTD